MTPAFAIDTGASAVPLAISGLVDEGSRISFRDFAKCEKMSRRIVSAIYACETTADLEAYERAEGLVIDGIYLAWPELFVPICDALATQYACLAPRPPLPTPGNPPPTASAPTQKQSSTVMFIIDTGADSTGSKGPWINFKPKGSAKHGLPYKSWILRDKDESGATVTKFGGMENPGVILDIYALNGELCGSLKLGFSKSDGLAGVAPERRWFASPLRAEPRPSEERKAAGGYAWSNALSVRVAIGGGKVATWEDDGWGVYKGFSGLVKQLNQGFADNVGLCPLVRCTGYVEEGQGQNTTFVPQFTVVGWKPRPDCLKEDAPAIQADPAPAPVQPAPAPKAAPAPADLEDLPF